MFIFRHCINIVQTLPHKDYDYVIKNDTTKIYESIVDDEVICDNCGWSWKLSEGGDDPYTCHKCEPIDN